MEKAKRAVSDFISKSGHHDTTVHERVAPSIEHQTVAPTQVEERQIATDREVHQEHYHTTVQPVNHREVLPEQHHHNIVPVEHRTHDRRDKENINARLEKDAAQFKDQSVRAEIKYTSATAPSIAGEHVHHHIHETIQPVIHKETIEPHVIHTTVPIHEVHHNAPQHHATSALPAVSLADFKKQGGVLSGRDERTDQFSGEPKSIEHALGDHRGNGNKRNATAMPNTQHGFEPKSSSSTGSTNANKSAVTGSSHTDQQRTGMITEAEFGYHNDDLTDTGSGPVGQNIMNKSAVPNTGSSSEKGMKNASNPSNGSERKTSTTRKASLIDRLNPLKDADGDGKKGFMD